MKHLRYIFSALVLGVALGQSATALAGDEQELAEAGSFFQQPLVTETGQEAIATETRQGLAAANSVQSTDTAPGEGNSEVVTNPFNNRNSASLRQ